MEEENKVNAKGLGTPSTSGIAQVADLEGDVEGAALDGSDAGSESGLKHDGCRRKVPRWVFWAAGVLVVAVVAACGFAVWTHVRHQSALADCHGVVSSLGRSVRAYKSDEVSAALKLKAADVSDGKTVADAAKAVEAVPVSLTVSCDVSASRTDLDAATDDAGRVKVKVDRAVKAAHAVAGSHETKILGDARTLYDSSTGKVADEAVRTALKKAMDDKDVDAVSKAADAVNVSVKAKAEADAKAAAEAAEAERQSQAEAAQRAAAQAQASQTMDSYSASTQLQNGLNGGGNTAVPLTPAPTPSDDEGYDPDWVQHAHDKAAAEGWVDHHGCNADGVCGIG